MFIRLFKTLACVILVISLATAASCANSGGDVSSVPSSSSQAANADTVNISVDEWVPPENTNLKEVLEQLAEPYELEYAIITQGWNDLSVDFTVYSSKYIDRFEDFPLTLSDEQNNYDQVGGGDFYVRFFCTNPQKYIKVTIDSKMRIDVSDNSGEAAQNYTVFYDCGLAYDELPKTVTDGYINIVDYETYKMLTE
mgnify:CR=1 FL=1